MDLGQRQRHRPGHVLQPQPRQRYTQHTYSLASFAGTTVALKFSGTEDSSLQTSFVVDDTAVNTG
jgi:hypothetical protein